MSNINIENIKNTIIDRNFTENFDDSSIELNRIRANRAKRLKSLRRLTGKSRREFAEKYGIPPGTLQNWEDARYGGLTEKGAKRVIKAFNAEGIFCTLEWLMHGIGANPQISDRLYLSDSIGGGITGYAAPTTTVTSPQQVSTPIPQQSFSTIVQELLLFRQLNPNTIDTVVVDDGMEPRFIVNEQVAGIQRFGDLSSLIGLDCIGPNLPR